ncbi:BNR-4 repeat-containing protein [Microbacterium sp. NPDC058342]|uniref:BNR-4 repeat-containing protein n=1 Tax=Microbacterium sp. NPDC058342 TaxID=3346454 RepID=UPI0036487334
MMGVPITRRALALAAAAIAATTAAALGPAASAAESPIEAETVPVTVDGSNQSGWWNPLAVDGDTTYFAYNVPAGTGRHEVHLASRAAGGPWTTGCLRLAAGACADYLNDNGHNQPSIAIDGEGHIHVFASMHHEDWNYFRSTTAGDVTSLVEVSEEMPDQGGTISYPITSVGPDGDVWLMVRTGPDAQARRDGVLYHYDVAAKSWARETVIASATNYSVYPDDLVVDDDGRVHVLWEWHRWAAGPYRHLGSYAIWNPEDRTFRDVDGGALPVPIRPESTGPVVFQPFTADEDMNSTTPAVQTAKMAVRDGRLEGIVYRYSAAGSALFDLKWAAWDGTEWNRDVLIDSAALGSGVDTIATMDATSLGSATRVYAVLSVQTCDAVRSQVVMLERTQGQAAWAAEAVGDAVAGQQRLRAATTTAGTDVLYLSAPATPGGGTLRYAEVPRAGRGAADTALADIVSVVRGDGGGVDLALGGTATASSQLRDDTGPELAFDGVCSDASRWISAVGDAQPWIMVEWDEAAPLDVVRVRSGYLGGAMQPSVLRDFTVEARTAQGWTPLATIQRNVSDVVVVDAKKVTADAVRLLITNPSDSATDVARVFGIEAIAANDAPAEPGIPSPSPSPSPGDGDDGDDDGSGDDDGGPGDGDSGGPDDDGSGVAGPDGDEASAGGSLASTGGGVPLLFGGAALLLTLGGVALRFIRRRPGPSSTS